MKAILNARKNYTLLRGLYDCRATSRGPDGKEDLRKPFISSPLVDRSKIYGGCTWAVDKIK
jgi:hypothetical protein